MLEEKLAFLEKLETALENAKSKKQPIRKRLLLELISAFSELDEFCPKATIISLNGSYSHKLIKSTLNQIGYVSVSKSPNPKRFRVKRQF